MDHMSVEQHSQTPCIDAQRVAANIGRIEDEKIDQGEAKNADRQVDVEHPTPGIGIGDPATQSRAEDRRRHDAHTPECRRFAALFSGKFLKQHSLGDRLESSAGRTLQHPKEDQSRQAGSHSTKHARERKSRHHRHQQALSAQIVR